VSAPTLRLIAAQYERVKMEVKRRTAEAAAAAVADGDDGDASNAWRYKQGGDADDKSENDKTDNNSDDDDHDDDDDIMGPEASPANRAVFDDRLRARQTARRAVIEARVLKEIENEANGEALIQQQNTAESHFVNTLISLMVGAAHTYMLMYTLCMQVSH
jgi:hypothetical protein